MRAREIRDRAAARGGGSRGGRGSRRLPVATALAAVMTLSACAGADAPGSAPTPGGTQDATDDALDPRLPLLQIEHSGGFVLMGTDFASVPELTVYPDGAAITHGPQIAIYPPPALPNLLRQDLTDADVDALVAAARDAGLLDAVPEYGQPPVADAPTTFVTLRVDGRELVHAAEALGIGDGPIGQETEARDGGGAEEDLPGNEPLPGLTDDERAARAELAAFVARAHELVGTAGEGEQYTIDAFAVMARPAPDDAAADEAEPPAAEGDPAGTSPAPDDGLERQVLAWPLALPLADAAECVLVDGADAGTLRDTLAGASFTTLFEQDDVRYDVWFRPLLPHEEGCEDV